jgi:hypothetical protein
MAEIRKPWTGPIEKKARRRRPKHHPPAEGQRRPREEDPIYLDCIRQCPCLICGREGVEAAHVRFGSLERDKPTTGMQIKPSDQWTVPLCQEHHRAQHSRGERQWWAEQQIDVLAVCDELWAQRYDVTAMRAIVMRWGDLG